MGGHIEVQSCAGKGTVFTLYFPAKAAQDSENVKASAAGLKDYSGKGEKILVVDDSDEQREIATGMLTKLGYSVTAVPSGEIALAYLGVDTADLVLLDMIMSPGMDGLDTYRKIIELQPGQKAIIASGYSETERVREAQKLGAGCYIRKPYLMENIGAAIREELDREGGAPRLKAS
jgi:CheY-like chemotaxis protein